MAGTVFKLYMGKRKEAWYQLSDNEQKSLIAKVNDAFERIGGKAIVACNSSWSSEQHQFFGVEEFPDIEAVQKHGEDLTELDWHRYMEITSMLGTKSEG